MDKGEESSNADKTLKNEISELKELYSKELERQSEDRKTQSEIVEQDKINDVETEKIEKEEAIKRFNQLLEKLGSIDNKLTVDSTESNENELLVSELREVNENLKSIITYQENSHQYELNNQSLTTMGVAVLIVGFGVFALYKFGSFIVSKIINMIN